MTGDDSDPVTPRCSAWSHGVTVVAVAGSLDTAGEGAPVVPVGADLVEVGITSVDDVRFVAELTESADVGVVVRTWSPAVAREAIGAGAVAIHDPWALVHPDLAGVVGAGGVGLMVPSESLDAALDAGIDPSRIAATTPGQTPGTDSTGSWPAGVVWTVDHVTEATSGTTHAAAVANLVAALVAGVGVVRTHDVRTVARAVDLVATIEGFRRDRETVAGGVS